MEHAGNWAKKKKTGSTGWWQGVYLTLILALAANMIATLPPFTMLGPMLTAILLGIAWRSVLGIPGTAAAGISFSGKTLLRLGIVLLGVRFNLADIFHGGPKVLAIAAANLAFALVVVYWIARWFHVEKRLALLTAAGTAICGAAAVAAIAPQVKSKDEETAVGVAAIAILGTIFTVAYTLLFPALGLNDTAFGVFAGATLHEVAHVIAAAAPAGSTATDMAVIVKLTRVILLIPAALIIGFLMNRSEQKPEPKKEGAVQISNRLPVPWFIFGFLAMGAIHTLGIAPAAVIPPLVNVAGLLMAMAMAGIGLNVDIASFRRLGARTLAGGFIGSVLLSLLGFVLVKAFGF